MRLELAKAIRRCHDKDCHVKIARGEICGVADEENNFGTKKVFFCKVCTIIGLQAKKNIIEKQLVMVRSL